MNKQTSYITSNHMGIFRFLITVGTIITIFFSTNQYVYSQGTMSNSSFKIKLPSLNTFTGKVSNDQYKVELKGDQLINKVYTGENYTVTTGLPSQQTTDLSINPFTFSISSSFIDFGPLTPGEPVTRTNTMSVESGATNGYVVYGFEDKPLSTKENDLTIPDTTCDSGTCNEARGALWESLTTYGFGYRCDNIKGSDCSYEFDNPGYFRQFASLASNEIPYPVLFGILPNDLAEAQISYKVIISNTQPAGIYNNAVSFIAIPSL